MQTEEQTKVTSVTVKDIDSLDVLRRFSRDLNLITGLTFAFADAEGRPAYRLNRISCMCNPICSSVLRVPAGRKACEACDAKNMKSALQERKPLVYLCHLGLMNVLVPLVVRDTAVGLFATGGCLANPPTKKGFAKLRNRLAELGIPCRWAHRLYYTSPVVPSGKAEALVDLISLVSERVADIEKQIVEFRRMTKQDTLRRVQEIIETQYAKPLTISDVGRMVGISSSRLAHILKDRLGTTFTSWRNQIRIDKARYLLANSDQPVVHISLEVGFESLSHFYSLFERVTGIPPRKYRNLHSPLEEPVTKFGSA